MNGRLYPNGIPEWGPWEASRLHWWPEDHLDLILSTTGERKVRTVEELEAAIKEPMTVAPTRNVWIHESLEDEARRVCEAGRPIEILSVRPSACGVQRTSERIGRGVPGSPNEKSSQTYRSAVSTFPSSLLC
jgi:hypothetical protein